jgi:hypothetical protein
LSSETIQNKRRNFALTHTWENSIGSMGDAYFQMNKKFQTI